MRTNELYNLAQAHGIRVDCMRLPYTQSLSIYYEGKSYIAIDPLQLETNAQERERLSHELGHCETGCFYNRYSPCDVRGRHEERANRWAVRALIRRDELDEAIRCGIREVWELAEYFDVTEDFMKKALSYYQMLDQAQADAAGF